MKECPQCEVVNPDTAERCDCGYDFVADPMGASEPAAKRAIRSVLKVIAGFAGAVWLFAPVSGSPGPMVFVVATLVLFGCGVALMLLEHVGDMGWWPKRRDPKT
jgi:hypothetical protein